MTPETALVQLTALAQPAKAAEMAAYHKAPRVYLGLSNPQIDALAREWRADGTLDDRLALAAGLWASDVHEARIAAAKLLTQARIRPDDAGAWALIAAWVPDLDGMALADAVAVAGQKRLVADPARLEQVAGWVASPHPWTRRAALALTLPWAKLTHPRPDDLAQRDRVLGWAAELAGDPARIVQKALAEWLYALSKRDGAQVRHFLEAHGERMKPFARKDAARLLR
ncbi:MAG: DNA alkylation repair protein [Rhodobacteraceae bacterium]|nr:DNA alkylation repair protein [Paracoccaceae bacterium]